MDIDNFIHDPSEVWRPIKNTGLECANTGRIRYSDSHKFYGELVFFEDLPALRELGADLRRE